MNNKTNHTDTREQQVLRNAQMNDQQDNHIEITRALRSLQDMIPDIMNFPVVTNSSKSKLRELITID